MFFKLKNLQVVIGLIGKQGAGKDTLADHAVKAWGIKDKIALAQELKMICSRVFKIPLKDFHDNKNTPFIRPITIQGMHVRRILDDMRAAISYEILPLKQFSANKIGVQNHTGRVCKTPREILQFVGTEIMRHYWTDVHSYLAFDKYIGVSGAYVVTDIRFISEVEYAQKAFPLFYPVKIIGRTSNENDSHSSETECDDIVPFAQIDNSKDIETFILNAESVFNSIKKDALKRSKEFGPEELQARFPFESVQAKMAAFGVNEYSDKTLNGRFSFVSSQKVEPVRVVGLD